MCRNFLASGFATALKPDKFTGTYFKRWQTKTTLWLTAMNMFWVVGVSTGTNCSWTGEGVQRGHHRISISSS